MKIDFANLQLQYQEYKIQIEQRIKSILDKSNYILGNEVQELEDSLKVFAGVKHSICCSSGTDALILALMAINIQPDDEVITTPFSWISTAETIAFLKAKPVFVDIEPDTFNIDLNLIENAITKKTKAIIPVSLFGQPADIDGIQKIAKKFNLKIIIDGAQSFGSTYKDKTDSSLGDISITSFFPSKPLGCYGDGGGVFTNNDNYAKKINMLRVHGQNKRNFHKYIGIGGRMDTIQAAVLLAKLPFFKKEISNRKKFADYYTKNLNDYLITPILKNDRQSVWAQYTIRVKNRDSIKLDLEKRGIPTFVFYPLPMHLQECFKYLKYRTGDFPISERVSNEVLSLPINAFLNYDNLDYIIQSIKECINSN